MSGLLSTAAQLASPWAYLVLALAAAAESAAFVGLFVPGETAMLLGGFLAFRGRVSLEAMMAAGALGAVVGDSVGFEIGRRFGNRDHTTVLHAIRKIEQLMSDDNQLREEIELLKRLLRD